MENTYGEFQGTELDPSLDFDFDDEENDLLPILGLSALVAGIVGAVLVVLGRRREPTPTERAAEALQAASKQGKKGLAAASKAAEEADLRGMLDDAIKKARKTTKDSDLEEMLSSALDAVKEAGKRAEKAAGDVDLKGARKGLQGSALVSLLQDALDKAKDVSSRVDASDLRDAASDAGKRASKAISKIEMPEVDAEKTGKVLDDLRDRLVAAVEAVRNDVAPKAVDTLRETVIPTVQEAAMSVAHRVQEDVLPPAQDAVGKFREDVLPSAQERVGKLAEDYHVAGHARKVGDTARSGAGNISGMIQGIALAVLEKMVQDILPEARKAGNRAATIAKEDVIPGATKTAGDAAQRVREDVLPWVGDAAAKAPDMLSDLLALARERASDAMDKATPAVSDAATFGRHRAADAATFGRHRAADVAGAVQGNKKSVSKKASSAKEGVTGAVGTVVGATTYTARETTGIIWWLSMLGALILLIFVPERDKQEEFWNNLRQFLGEVREMWRDLQGPDEFDAFDTETPTTQ